MDKSETELKRVMQQFCNIVMPGHDKKKGYINVKKKVEELKVDRRTYYHWKNGQACPRLGDFLKRLNEKGYSIEIVPRYDL